MEKKTCTKCKLEKPLSEFHKDKSEKDGYTFRCKDCRNNYYNQYYLNNPEKAVEKNKKQKENRKNFYKSEKGVESSRKAHLKRMYGITLDDYNKILKDQNYCCAICEGFETHDKHGVLAVDHNHTTGEVRGLLCYKCNTGLGSYNDDINLFNKAIKYLEKYDKI